jgi:3-oxoacyl-(acyl-carrier-protein) synthase
LIAQYLADRECPETIPYDHPDGEQIVRAMQLAIARSGRSVDEIGYVNYHGTATVLNDAVEARAVRALLGRRGGGGAGAGGEGGGGGI